MNIAVQATVPPAEGSGDIPEQIELPGITISSWEFEGERQPESPSKPENSTEFDWLAEDCIIVEEQPSIAVYRNKRNHVVIRRRADGDDEDAFVFVGTPEGLKLLITALQRELRDWR